MRNEELVRKVRIVMLVS